MEQTYIAGKLINGLPVKLHNLIVQSVKSHFMYKVIINDQIVYKTDNLSDYIMYCIDHNYSAHVLRELLEDKSYTLKLATQ